MFSTCVYCHGALGANEVVESFPVGRKLAFDAARGRLWAVCPQCARWNLSPLEERWEAIETCEKLYRSTPLKASTDNIGLAKLSEGLQLVRVGQPTRPEFAAWRYGSEFHRRRLNAVLMYGGSSALILGLMGLRYMNPSMHDAIPLAGALPTVWNLWTVYRGIIQRVSRVPHKGTNVSIRRPDLQNVRLELRDSVEASGEWWQLNVLHREGRSVLTGPDAKRVLGNVLVVTNEGGGSKDRVNSAVRLLADAGSAEQFMRDHIRQQKGTLAGWGEARTERALALEMALHEDTERAALEGDLASLERAWEEAEQIAAIADNLLLPDWIQQRLPGVRTRHHK